MYIQINININNNVKIDAFEKINPRARKIIENVER